LQVSYNISLNFDYLTSLIENNSINIKLSDSFELEIENQKTKSKIILFNRNEIINSKGFVSIRISDNYIELLLFTNLVENLMLIKSIVFSSPIQIVKISVNDFESDFKKFAYYII
jgi:hypothetical protein